MPKANALLHCAGMMVGLLALLLAGAQLPAQAALPATPPPTFNVNITSDAVASLPLNSGPCETGPGNHLCSLRAAIMKANHWPGGGASIHLPALPAGQKYLLTIPPSGPDDEASGDLNISTTVTLLGGGANQTIIDGEGGITNDRVFMIEAGAVASLSGVTIENGFTSGDGGGLYNRGRLTLDSAEVLSNTTNSATLGGGGLYSIGPLTITRSLILHNQAIDANGGGIYNNSGLISLADSTIAANGASLSGGGIENGGTLVVNRSTISGNATGNDGGGLDNIGSATLRDSSVISNNALEGGGVRNIAATVNLVNSTVSGNGATIDGGGIDNSCGCATTVNLFNTTVANNQADSDFNGSGTGGGIFNFNSPSDVVEIQNSLIANNHASFFVFKVGYEPWPSDCNGTLASLEYNLVSNMAGCHLSGGAHDHPGVPALLGPLQDNGGPTWTQAPLPGSPALDAGNDMIGCRDNLGALLPTDQRGRPRTANGAGLTRCDIGAYELQRTILLPLVRR